VARPVACVEPKLLFLLSWYHVFATMDGFNDVLKDEDEENDAYWQPWEVNEDLFDRMRVYYKEQADSNVKCYELGGDCQSDNEE